MLRSSVVSNSNSNSKFKFKIVISKFWQHQAGWWPADECYKPANHSFSLNTTLRPKRNEQHFADDIFKRIFFNENIWISIKISLKFVPKGPINNISALVQIMAWRRSGGKPLSEPMMVSLPTHICVTRLQWVNNNSGHKRIKIYPFCMTMTYS